MSTPTHIYLTGFLGAGKTRLRRRLLEDGAPDLTELDGLADPAPFRDQTPQAVVVCVADAVNFDRQTGDAGLSALVHHQIRCSDCVAVSRTDLVDAGPVLDRLGSLTGVPVVPADALDWRTLRTAGSTGAMTAQDLTDSFLTWRYQGPAVLSPAQAERLMERRPKGVYRLSGQLRVPGGGLEVELAGRFRQTLPIADPGETVLSARGPKARFSRHEMDVLFAELMADSAFRAGIFNHR